MLQILDLEVGVIKFNNYNNIFYHPITYCNYYHFSNFDLPHNYYIYVELFFLIFYDKNVHL